MQGESEQAMSTHHLAAWIVVATALSCAIGASAQSYPTKPVRLVTAEPGGGNDFAARLIVQGLGGSLGQPMIVDNRGGAGGLIAASAVAKAPPDGYTLLLYANNVWIIPLLQRNAPYDVIRDFVPITWAAKSPNAVVVHPSLPVKSVTDLVALAKARPGELNYGSGGNGSSTHLAVELFKSMARVDIVRVVYKGNGPALTALMAGEIQLMIVPVGSLSAHLNSTRLRAVAVTSAEPSPLVPGLPTVAAAGLPGYESMQIYGVFAPAGTSAAVVTRLNEAIVRVLARPDVKQKFLASGVETVGSTPQELAATMKSEIVRIGKVIKEAGIRGD